VTPTVGLGWALARRYNGCLLVLSSASVSIADADYRRQLQLATSDPVAYYSTPQPSVALLAEHQTQQLRTWDASTLLFTTNIFDVFLVSNCRCSLTIYITLTPTVAVWIQL